MPQTYDALHRKFYEEDGIEKAEGILERSGFRVDRWTWTITAPVEADYGFFTKGDQMDAVDYLIEEWDYGYSELPR